MTWRTAPHPGLVPLCRFLQVRKELLVGKPLAKLWDDGFEEFPDSEELSACFEEEILVEQPVVEQRTSLLPVAHHHSRERAAFRAWRGDAHRKSDLFE